MGWRYRKTTRLGPLRLTLTHRGLSGSVGSGGLSYQLFGPGKKKGNSVGQGSLVSGLFSLIVLVFGSLIVIGFVGSLIGRSQKSSNVAESQLTRDLPSATELVSAISPSPPTKNSIDRKSISLSVNESAAVVDETTLENEIEVSTTPSLLETTPAIVKLEAPADVEPLRVWTDSTGKHKTKAALIDFKGGKVYLRSAKGKIAPVLLSRLSEYDAAFVKSQYDVEIVTGKVLGVSEGDVISVRTENANYSHKVRLAGIDAPEKLQENGKEIRHTLSEKLFGKNVRVEWSNRDNKDRLIGDVYLNDEWINLTLVSQGYAWEHGGSLVLEEAEKDARNRKLGLWAGLRPSPPWEFVSIPPKPRRDFALEETTSKRRYSTPSNSFSNDSSSSYTPSPSYSSPSSGGSVSVRGYYRKNGTYVRPHTRSAPRR